MRLRIRTACPAWSLCLLCALPCCRLTAALAVDTMNVARMHPDLTSVRHKIAGRGLPGARSPSSKSLADTNQHADVYSLMGFSLRKMGELPDGAHFLQEGAGLLMPIARAPANIWASSMSSTGRLPKAASSLRS